MSRATRSRRRRAIQPRAEGLEGRCLLSEGLGGVRIPIDSPLILLQPGPSVEGSDGSVWTGMEVQPGYDKPRAVVVYRHSPSGTFTPFLFPPEAGGSFEGSLAAAADGSVWFLTDQAVCRIAPDGTMSDFARPTDVETEPAAMSNEGGAYGGITLGPDGAVWFTDVDDGFIGRMTTSGQFSEFPIPLMKQSFGSPTPFFTRMVSRLWGPIVSGPDGALWFTEGTGAIGRLTTGGAYSEYSLPSGDYAEHLTVGPDGALWFTGIRFGGAPDGTPLIGRMTTSGATTVFALLPSDRSIQESSLTAGPDGALWFLADATGPTVGRISTAGTLTEFPVPAHVPGDTSEAGSPYSLTAGPDGKLWMAYGWGGPAVVEFDPSQVITAGGVPVSAHAGTPFTTTVANITAPAADVQAGALSATINWGDGQSSAGTIAANPDGTYRIIGIHMFNKTGNETITVSIVDTSSGGTPITVTSPVQVTDPPPASTVGTNGPGGSSAPSVGRNDLPGHLVSNLPAGRGGLTDTPRSFRQRMEFFFRLRAFERSHGTTHQDKAHRAPHRHSRPLQPRLANGPMTVAQRGIPSGMMVQAHRTPDRYHLFHGTQR